MARKLKPTKNTETGLTDFQQRVADEYLVDGRAGPAYRRAGGKAKDPYRSGCEIVGNAKVVAYIRKRQAEIGEKLGISAEAVLQRWWEIATCDANELVQHRRRACRYCYGDGHHFQWVDENEWLEACRQAELAEPPRPLPDNEGGYGYIRSADPHQDCPRCDGEGEASIYVADTRRLSPQARALYAGIKTTKEGMEVKTQDQAKALENVAKHLGMLRQDVSVDVPEDSPLSALIQAINGGRGNTLGPASDDDPDS